MYIFSVSLSILSLSSARHKATANKPIIFPLPEEPVGTEKIHFRTPPASLYQRRIRRDFRNFAAGDTFPYTVRQKA